ncbi:MAG: hypothetical protein QF815_02455 [Candidatus Peribacteraceae bacterium]|jgi:uncharacterized phage infection (PIP) family protein YhgE|nr:hypothetical protein [Candidatus Peribacteraceae bacterium]
MASSPSPEKGNQQTESTETKNLVVTQPDKFQGLLETITLMDKVSESMGEDKSGDLGGGGTGGGSAQGDQSQSARAQAIANIPDTPEMREELAKYIQKEIKVLRKQVRKKTFKMSKPGAAHSRNELYSQIRRLNSLLAELIEASVEVLKRLFIRVFVDKQSI